MASNPIQSAPSHLESNPTLRRFFRSAFAANLLALVGSQSPLHADTVPGELPVIRLEEIELTAPAPSLKSVGADASLPARSITRLEESASPLQDLAGSTGAAATFGGSQQPGRRMQWRGQGRSAEEVQVQTLGVPLNMPQGGGFDFSSLPSFLWSGATVQTAASTASRLPQTSAESVELSAWSAEFQAGPARIGRLRLNSDAAELAAGQRTSRYGVMGGLLAGPVQGGGLSASTQGQWQRLRVGAHLLGASLRTDLPGSLNFQTPGASQTSHRYLTVIESELSLGSGRRLRSSLYGTLSQIDYQDPGKLSGFRFTSSDLAIQAGAQSDLITKHTNNIESAMGGAARLIHFQSNVGAAPGSPLNEAQGEIHGKLKFRAGRYGSLGEFNPRLELSAALIGATKQGALPALSAGLSASPRIPKLDRFEFYLRPSFVKRMASLVDHYYSVPGYFIGNPELKPENVTSLHLGHSLWAGRVEYSSELALSHRSDAQVFTDAAVLVPGESTPRATLLNSGDAVGASWQNTATLRFHPMLSWSDSVSLSYSHLSATGTPFPLQAPFSNFMKLSLHDPRPLNTDQDNMAPVKWELNLGVQLLSSRTVNLRGDTTGGFALYQLGALLRLERLTVGLNIENLTGRSIELIPGYPLPKTYATLAISTRLD